MLQKIIDYEERKHHFSRNDDERVNDDKLHHNSRVSNNKRYTEIDEENPKLYNRITHASSEYSQQKLKPKTMLLTTFRVSNLQKRYLTEEKVKSLGNNL